jgi:nitroreductase
MSNLSNDIQTNALKHLCLLVFAFLAVRRLRRSLQVSNATLNAKRTTANSLICNSNAFFLSVIWKYYFGEIMLNPVLKAIKNRRNDVSFKSTIIPDEKLDAILEAGRWAPSWTNMQPWRFIVVKDKMIKEKMSDAVSTFFKMGLREAPLCISVCVNPELDPFHFVEDGTAATQNMALAAESLGLSTSWIGVFSLHDDRNSTERKVKKILKIPKKWRLISILPVGLPRLRQHKKRKELSDIVDFGEFRIEEKNAKTVDTERSPRKDKQTAVPESARSPGAPLV